jgi:hypothetical protein
VARVTVIIFKPAVDEFRGWNGPVGRSVLRLAKEMRTQQIAIVGKKSGRLAQSISVGRRGRWARGIETSVGANAGVGRGRIGYSVWNDQGTLPHSIYPRRAPQLVFYWAKVGRVVHLNSVWHPGNKAYHWAERGARVAMRVWSGRI